MLEKAARAGADALILDLEDSVPPDEKHAARELVAANIPGLNEKEQRVWVRINKSIYLYDFEDLLAVVGPGLEGIFISKPDGPEDVHTASSMIAEAESRNGLEVGSINLIPLLESARSMQLCFKIAGIPRVAALVGSAGKNGDSARALSLVWSPDRREALYLKSRVVMAARAAGKLPIGGLWHQVKDLEGQEEASRLDRQLGMTGELILHPGQVEVVNRVYSPTAEEIAYYRGMIEALEKAKAGGRASVLYEGEHIDIAHVTTARYIIELAQEFDL
jgi:citrate lyase subunit beta/citryl-CoA lyase